MKTAFIGLGVMGYPMAGYLAKAGHDVTVFNRTAGKAESWLEAYQGSSASTPAAAAEGADDEIGPLALDMKVAGLHAGDRAA